MLIIMDFDTQKVVEKPFPDKKQVAIYVRIAMK